MIKRVMHIQIAVDLDEASGKHTVTCTNLMSTALGAGTTTINREDDLGEDEVADEVIGFALELAEDAGFETPEDEGGEEEEEDDGDD